MPAFIAKKLVQMLIHRGRSPRDGKVLVMGITFKENVSDIRNSKVADLIKELMGYSINVHSIDPLAHPNEVAHEYQLTLNETYSDNYDAVIVAVAHDEYKTLDKAYFKGIMKADPILLDLKGLYPWLDDKDITYWSL